MIEFFKHLLSKINFKSDNEDLNKLNKIPDVNIPKMATETSFRLNM